MAPKPRILLFDVETKPVRAWIWKTSYKMSVGHEQICKGERFDILCICYKWLGESKIHSLDWGLKAQDSSAMIEAFTKVIESADLSIGHNSDKFDIKQINTQRLIHGQKPIAWPTSEDTLKQFRKHFAFPSYKLDYIAKLLTGSGKTRMQFDDWLDIVVDKNPDALEKMIKYCKRDVLKLEQIYKQASKFFTPKIHAGLLTGYGKAACPRCGVFNIRLNGTIINRTGRYHRFQCKECATCFRDNKKI